MSLIKQLWIAIAVFTLLAFSGSLVLSTMSARQYLEEQLRLKNVDNATSLALSMSQLPKDPVTIDLLLAAQFDAGHYQYIRITGPDGALIAARENAASKSQAPSWFMALVPIRVSEGSAQVQDGWRQFGTLSLKSQSSFAYQSLWHATLELLLWFAMGAALCGVLGTALLKRLLAPLRGVVEHARAIGERRFITTPESTTTEFRAVVSAMNQLSARVSTMLAEESTRLEALRMQTQHDDVTGVLNRTHFLNIVDEALESEKAPSGGLLALIRMPELADLNHEIGRETVDAMLRQLAAALSGFADAQHGWAIGRMNGSDFALLAPDAGPGDDIPARLGEVVDHAVGEHMRSSNLQLAIGLASYRRGDTLPQLLSHADLALAKAAAQGGRPVLEAVNAVLHPVTDLAGWRAGLSAALDAGRLALHTFPVMNAKGRLLHHEAPARLRLERNGEWLCAGEFMSWAGRAGLLERIDLMVLEHALARLRSSPDPLCINLSSGSMCNGASLAQIRSRLAAEPGLARRLWIDLPEAAAYSQIVAFRAFCAELKPLGCQIGLEHVGQHVGRIGELSEIGLDYLKIARATSRGVALNTGSQTFLRGLATISHAMGMKIIAEGVASTDEAEMLLKLGFDGLTGPGILDTTR